MKLPVYGSYLAVLIPAFAVYLYAESMLRQGAISNIDSKKFNIDTVIAELPGSLKDAVSYRIHYGQLQDAIRSAGNDRELAMALSNMADFVNEPEKRVELYEQVLKRFSAYPESSRAFTFFLNNFQTKTSVTIPQFHQYLKQFSQLDQYYVWTIGLSKLRQMQTSDAELLKFMKPLLDIKPEFRDYSGLYRQIAELAVKLDDKEDYRRAMKQEEACLDMPMLESVYMEQIEKKMPATKTSGAKPAAGKTPATKPAATKEQAKAPVTQAKATK